MGVVRLLGAAAKTTPNTRWKKVRRLGVVSGESVVIHCDRIEPLDNRHREQNYTWLLRF